MTMFNHHPMRYSVRRKIAEHAYSSTKRRLQRDSDKLRATFARHGLDFDVRRLGKSTARADAKRKGSRILSRLSQLEIVKRWVGAEAPEPFL
jgi:hypothetical protein